MHILIMSASTGGGHMRTSAAMKSYIEKNHPNDVVRVVDALEYAGHLYNKTVSDGYEFMAKNTPKLYGTFYNTANKENTLSNMADKFNKSFSRKLLPLILEFLPDVIIVVHAFAAEMVSTLRTKYNMSIPVICIITDFAPHKMYIQPKINEYVVSSEDMLASLVVNGVAEKNIHVLGIPIDTSFYKEFDIPVLKQELGLNPDMQTVLLMAGSFGVTDILRIYQSLSNTKYDFQIIVVTGKNQKLFDTFEYLLTKNADNPIDSSIEKFVKENEQDEYTKKPLVNEIADSLKDSADIIKNSIKDSFYENQIVQMLNPTRMGEKPTKLLYFVENINEYMAVSDLIVTKPGGLTVSESIAMGLPMAIFKSFPGQEEDNEKFLLSKNVAIKLPKNELSGKVIANLLQNEEVLNNMKSACKSLFKPNSAENVYKLAQKLADENSGRKGQ